MSRLKFGPDREEWVCTVRPIHFQRKLVRPRARRASVVDDENMVRPRARIWTLRAGASRDILHWDPYKEPAESEDLHPSPGACRKCL